MKCFNTKCNDSRLEQRSGCGKYGTERIGECLVYKTKELKFGDIVEINSSEKCDIWKERIFIKYAVSGGIACVTKESEEAYRAGYGFNTVLWKYNQWRVQKEKTYRSLQGEELNDLLGTKVKHKDGDINIVHSVSSDNNKVQVSYIRYSNIDFCRFYTYLDGTKIGIEK